MASLYTSCNFAPGREFSGDKSWVVCFKLRNSSVKCGLSSRLIDLETKMHITCGYNFKREGGFQNKFSPLGSFPKKPHLGRYLPKCISTPKIVGAFLVWNWIHWMTIIFGPMPLANNCFLWQRCHINAKITESSLLLGQLTFYGVLIFIYLVILTFIWHLCHRQQLLANDLGPKIIVNGMNIYIHSIQTKVIELR